MLVVSVVVLFASRTLVVAEEAKAPAPAEKAEAEKPAEKPTLRGQYAEMAKECKLSPEQTEDLIKAVQARRAAIDEARKAYEEAEKKADAQVMAVLSPDQKALWEGYNLSKSVAERFRKANLTDDQIAQLRALANEAGKAIVSAADPRRAASDARHDLINALEGKILKPEQRDLLRKLEEERRAQEKQRADEARKVREATKAAETKKPEEPKKTE
jgi:hypothetical protein